MRHRNSRSVALALLSGLCLAACAAHVAPSDQPLHTYRPGMPFRAVVGIAPIAGPDDPAFDPFVHGEGGLARAVGDGRLYRRAVYLGEREHRPDLILRGDVESQWDDDALANVLTWLPGGLALAPAWRGSHFGFGAIAAVQLIDARSGETLAEYSAEVWRELVDRSAAPGHLLAPDFHQRRLVYDAVYAELWERIATSIARDREALEATRRAERWQLCRNETHAEPQSCPAPWSGAVDSGDGTSGAARTRIAR